MFLDGATNHLPMHGAGLNIAPGFADTQKNLAARHLQFKKLVAAFLATTRADFPNANVGIQYSPGFLLQVEAILNRNRVPTHHTPRVFTVNFDAGRNHASLVVDRKQLHIGLVVAALHGGRRHLDLLYQPLLIGIHGVQAVHHVVLIHVRC